MQNDKEMLRSTVKNIFHWIKKYQHSIQLAIGFLATGLAILIVYLNRHDLILLLQMKIWDLAAIYLVYLLQFMAAAIPLWLIIRHLSGKSVPIIKWIKIMFVSRMANHLVPKSGGFYKAYILNNDYKVSYINFIQIYAFFSWLTVFINLGLVTLLIYIFLPTLKIGDYHAISIMAGMFVITLSGPLIMKYVLDFINPKETLFSSISEKIHGIFVVMLQQGRDIELMSKLIGVLILKFGLNVLLFKLLFSGMNIQIGYPQMSLFIAAQQVTIILFITPGNIGIRELLYGGIGGAIGIGVTEGLIASALLRVVGYVVVFPFSIAFGGLNVYRAIKARSSLKEGA